MNCLLQPKALDIKTCGSAFAGITLDILMYDSMGTDFYYRPNTQCKTTVHTDIHTHILFKITKWPHMHTFGLWEEVFIPGI